MIFLDVSVLVIRVISLFDGYWLGLYTVNVPLRLLGRWNSVILREDKPKNSKQAEN